MTAVAPSPLPPVAEVLTAAGFELDDPVAVRRTLLDTFDGRVHATGMRLELVEQDGRELVLSGPDTVPARLAVERPVRMATDLPFGPLRERLSRVLDVRALMPVVTVGARRTVARQRNRQGKVVAAVELYDHLDVEGVGEIALPEEVVEVPDLPGYETQRARTETLLRRAGVPETAADVIRLALAASGVDPRGYRSSPSPPLEPGEPATTGFGRVLANLADALEANWRGTVDDVDPEFLHDFRVAVRRTRSVLAEGKGVLPDEVRAPYRAAFKWLGDETTPARDLDVTIIEWDGYGASVPPDTRRDLQPVFDELQRRRSVAHEALSEVLTSPRYHDMISSWRAWTAAPFAADTKEAAKPLGAVVARRITRAHAQLMDRGRLINPSSPAEALHELRKDAKKLRYLLECFGAVLDASGRKRFVQRLKALQDNLGVHQDVEVHADELRQLTVDHPFPPSATLAVGQLVGELEQRRDDARTEFAERFAAFDTKQTRQALADLLEPATGA